MTKATVAEWIGGNIAPPILRSLDRRMKRLVTIASLFGYVFNRQVRDKDLEDRLSKVMDLTDNSNSLTLPILYHNMIWKIAEKVGDTSAILHAKEIAAKLSKTELTEREVENCAEVFISNLPIYLQYDSFEQIKYDLLQFFKSVPLILGSKYKDAAA